MEKIEILEFMIVGFMAITGLAFSSLSLLLCLDRKAIKKDKGEDKQ